MQQDHRIAIPVRGPHAPPAQRHPIVCSHLHIFERRIIALRYRLRPLHIGQCRCAPHRMQSPIRSHHADNHANRQPYRGNPQPTA